MPLPGRHRPVGRFIAAAVAAIALAALTGCAVDMSDRAPSPLPEGVTVALVQLRSDVAARQAQVEVHNHTDRPIHIGDVTVSDARFAEPATRVLEHETTVPAGRTVDIRIQLPDMACDVAGGTSTVQLTFVGRGAPDLREGPLPDKLDALPPIHEKECRAQALARGATVEIASFAPSPAGEPADLALEVAPTGAAAAHLIDIQSTNLLTYAGYEGVAFPLDVDVAAGDADAITVHLPLVPLRCDPHAVQEDKRGTVFNLDVELDGAPGVVQIPASEEMRGRILTWVTQWCGYGS